MKRAIVFVVGAFCALTAVQAATWTLSTFNPGDFKIPDHWLTGGASNDNSRNGSVTQGGGDPYVFMSVGKAQTWNFAEPQDLSEISLYFYDATCCGVAFDGVYVQYADADDYVLVDGTAVTYDMTKPNGKKQLLYLNTYGDAAFKNVKALKIVPTQVNTAWYGTRVYEIVVAGIASASEGVEWKFSDYDVSAFAKPDDAIVPTNELVESSSGFSQNEYDGDASTVSTHWYSGMTYVWNFKKPINVRAIEMFSNSSDSNFSKFGISDVYVKEKGASEWRRVGGSSHQFFWICGMRTAQHSRFVSMKTGKRALSNVVGVKLVVANPVLSYSGISVAEVYVCGKKATPGFTVVIN